MPWIIKSEFKDRETGKASETTQRVPAQANVTDEITTAFRAILFETLANAADDNSDLTVTVAYIGERS